VCVHVVRSEEDRATTDH